MARMLLKVMGMKHLNRSKLMYTVVLTLTLGCFASACSVEVETSSTTLGLDCAYACASGDTTPAAWVCDGDFDCLDGSDEDDCTLSGAFICADGDTTLAAWVCDGDEDCFDGSDEFDCVCR